MDIIRTLHLDGIQIPVAVEHAHMNLSQAESAGIPSARIDMLAIDIAVDYRGGPMREKSHAGVLNFMPLYQSLCLAPLRTLYGPLEAVLDETLDLIEQTARAGGLRLVRAVVTANRLGLVVGAPELRTERLYDVVPQLPPGDYRSAGISGVPLQIKVDHSWSQDVEHSGSPNPRPEVVVLRFAAVSPRQSLAADSLAGLYNYLKTYHVANAMHDMLIDGPFERLAEQIADRVLADSLTLQPKKLSVSITRSGYARCRPTLGLTIWRD